MCFESSQAILCYEYKWINYLSPYSKVGSRRRDSGMG